jgi:putative membrane protein
MAEAERLRAAVRSGRREAAAAKAETAQVAHSVEEPESRVIFAMGLKRLLLFGLFNFSMVYLAGLFGLIQAFERFLPFDIYDISRWAGLAEKSGLRSRFTPGAIATVLVLALLLGLIAGVVRTVARDYGFRLHAEGRRLRRERGLTTRSEVVLGKSRLQLALVETGPIRRRLGWFALSFQSLGAGSDQSGRQSAAPFARESEVGAILAEAGTFRLPEPDTLALVSRRHVLRSVTRLWLPALAVAIVSFWQPASLLILLPLVPLLALFAWIARRSHRYGLAGDLLFVQAGAWRRRLWVVPLASVQALSVSRSSIQRWLDLATLRIDTAGAPVMAGVRIVDLRTGPARALAAEIARRLPAYSSGRKSGTER